MTRTWRECFARRWNASRSTWYMPRAGSKRSDWPKRKTLTCSCWMCLSPTGDGFAVVNWLRGRFALCGTPTVVYSAREVDAAERDRLRLGRTEFFIKSRMAPDELAKRVLAMLAEHRLKQSA